ncbi:MAG: hypothetical protein FWC19_09040 [Treponema sp.]|nr:hypothetical protein [Treponema sp.]MCL2272927.1 hypothetical protein [Treponema sp.]
MDYGITMTEKNGDAYYSVKWSPLAKADRHDIITKVPSVAGVYEIYWMDDNNRLRMFVVGKTDYGGLRSEIRRITDPELCLTDEKARKILEEREIWYRYAETNSSKIMADVIWFFMRTYFPENTSVSHSGRYENIFLKESAPDKLFWVP